MYKTIDEAISVYKQKLKKYLEWLEPLKDRTSHRKNIAISEVNGFEHFDQDDYEKVTKWNAELVSVEQALGMDEKEIEKYLQEALAELEKV